MRNRIKQKYKYQVGDLIKSELPGTKIKHICIILEDENDLGHVKCLPVCNFSGDPGKREDYSIDISIYDLPEYWFEKGLKAKTWIRCNEVDCIYNTKFSKVDFLGNIKLQFPELWKEVCQAVYSCKISQRLEQACECEYDEINELINKGQIPIPDCGCDK